MVKVFRKTGQTLGGIQHVFPIKPSKMNRSKARNSRKKEEEEEVGGRNRAGCRRRSGVTITPAPLPPLCCPYQNFAAPNMLRGQKREVGRGRDER